MVNSSSSVFSNPIRRHAFFFLITAFLMVRYHYGTDDQVQLLPHLYRLIDPTFVNGDFYTETLYYMKHRLFALQMLAYIASFIGVPIMSMLLTLALNYLLIVITFHSAKRIGGCGDIGASVCVILLVGNPTSDFALRNIVTIRNMTLVGIAHVLVLTAFFFSFKSKVLLASLFILAASVFHPVIGIMYGFIVIATGIAFQIHNRKDNGHWTYINIAAIATSVVIYIIMSLFWYFIDRTEKVLSDTRFIELMCEFRHPHHYIVSSFPFTNLLRHFIFLLMLGYLIYDNIKFFKLNRDFPDVDRHIFSGRILAGILIFINISMMGTFFLIEIMQSRIGAIADCYRLNIFLIWLFIILLSKKAEQSFLSEKREWLRGIVMAASVWKMGVYQAFSALLSSLINRLLVKRLSWKFAYGVSVAIMFTGTAAIWYAVGIRSINYLFFPLILLLVLFINMRFINSMIPPILEIFVSIIFLGLALLTSYFDIPYENNKLFAKLRPDIQIQDSFRNHIELYAQIRDKTSEDSLFVVPQDAAPYSLLLRRKIFVDIKCFPFSDRPMEEWFSRVRDAYMDDNAAATNLPNLYKTSDEKLKYLHEKYGVTHALMDLRTKTIFPIVCKDNKLKAVRIE